MATDSYPGNKIARANVFLAQSLDGNELAYNTLDATLDLGEYRPTIFRPKGKDGMLTASDELFGVRPFISVLVKDPAAYQYGSVVLVFHNGKKIGKFYMTSITRAGKTHYRIACFSAVGMLTKSQHYGGIYTGQRFEDVAAEIIGGVVPFSVAPELADAVVYGWLPIAQRRDNLHQLLFALGGAVLRDENGDMFIAPLSDETHAAIPDSRLFLGGTVEFPDAVTEVSVTEHGFVSRDTDEVVTLFEGAIPYSTITTPAGNMAVGAVVPFREPMHDLSVVNAQILEYGVNYAVLSNSASCTLTGKKYTHSTRLVTRPEASTARSAGAENKITITDATLVSVANSENVADRIMSYYSSAKTVQMDIVVDGEKDGDAVSFTDPFGDQSEGLIESMDINLSGVLKAATRVVTGYSPGGSGNFYENLALVTSAGSWTVPAGVTKIRAIIIGGGDGGYSGGKGADGTSGGWVTANKTGTAEGGDGGDGGLKGPGGLGGKILIVTMSVTPGQVFPITIGAGGIGGVCAAAEPSAGTQGGASTFGSLSSADGVPSATGYIDLFNGNTYATPGSSGIANGSNGLGENKSSSPEITGPNGVTYKAGEPGATDRRTGTGWSVTSYGGYGGGAAYGSDGGNGANGRTDYNGGHGAGDGGDGGVGASASIPGANATVYGAGGQGGSGGGGGGGGGGGYSNNTWGFNGGDGGAGGLGSDGGNGAQGCVLIYF